MTTPWSFLLERFDAVASRSRMPYVTEPLAPYVPFRAAREYLRREVLDGKKMLLEQETICGVRWKHGPLWFDGFLCDQEPRLDPGPSRVVIWQPIIPCEKPKGWHRSWLQMNARTTGYAEVGLPENYWKSWTSHAQRHRAKWLKEERFTLEEVSLQAFSSAYRLSSRLGGWLKSAFIQHLERRQKYHGSLLHLFAAREKQSGELLAGFAALDIPEAYSSVHVISFLNARAFDSSVGTGLMDHWFRHALAHDIHYLDFDLFWGPGDPRAWKGFSRFKSQFGTHLIHYPMPFVRWVGREG